MAMIDNIWKDELYKYITGIIQTQKHKLLIINGVADHVHVLLGYRPHQSLSDLVQDIWESTPSGKGSSSKWINERKFTRSKFTWQKGYGAFSYSHSHLSKVIKYIQDQEQHQKKITFMEEYKSFLKTCEVEYNEPR